MGSTSVKWISLLSILLLTACRTQTPPDLPPSPPSAPKARIARIANIPLAPRVTTPAGFVITNIEVSGMVSLGWQGGIPPFQVQARSLDSPWQNVGLPTMARTWTGTANQPSQFYRVQQNVPLGVFLTNQSLSFIVPNLDMADSYTGSLRLYDDPGTGPQTVTPPGLISVAAGSYGSYLHTTLGQSGTIGIDNGTAGGRIATANGVVIPYSTQTYQTASPGQVIWGGAITSGSTDDDRIFGVARDSGGNIWVAGDSGATTATLYKLKSDGSLFDGVGPFGYISGSVGASIRAITVDSSNNIYVTGYYCVSIDFGNSQTLAAPGGYTGNMIFVAKFNSSGTCQWAKSFGGTGGFPSITNPQSGYGIALDTSVTPPTLVVCGAYWANPNTGVVDFGNGYSLQNYSSATDDYFVLKLASATGNTVWAFGAGGTRNDLAYAVSVDLVGNICVAGVLSIFSTTANLKGVSGPDVTVSPQNSGSADAFICLYNSSGVLQWHHNFGGSGAFNQVNAIAMDGSGNICCAGSFLASSQLPMDAGGGNVASQGSFINSMSDIFIIKYRGTDGAYLWGYYPGSTQGSQGTESGLGVCCDSNNNFIVVGEFWQTCNFLQSPSGPGLSSANLTSTGYGNAFTAKYKNDGTFLWAKTDGTVSDTEGATCVCIDGNNLIQAGSYQAGNDPLVSVNDFVMHNPAPTYLNGAGSGTSSILPRLGLHDKRDGFILKVSP